MSAPIAYFTVIAILPWLSFGTHFGALLFLIGVLMSHKCAISGVSRQNGHRVSHANNKTNHIFLANLQTKKIYIPSEKRSVRVKLSTRMIRTIDKLGLEEALRKNGMSVSDLL